MKLTELITSPWAVQPETLLEIQAIYATHLKGDKIDLAAVEARLGRPLASDQQDYQVRDGGVAVLPIEGVIAPKANLFTRVSGGASAQMLVKQVESAVADSRVKALVLAMDSPGGSVFGAPELAAAVREAGQVKPVVAVADAGTMASAAYWVGSAANAVYLSGPTASAGSIGVIARLSWDAPSATGVDVARGRYKRPSLNGQAPSAEFMAYYEAQLDHLYSVFVDAVAQHRGVSAEQVLERMADGRMFIGQQAVDAGLVDGLATVDALVEQLAIQPAQFAARRKAVFALGHPAAAGDAAAVSASEPVLLETLHNASNERTETMDRETLEREHPALFAQLRTDIATEAVQAELARQSGVRATALPGHEALVERLAADGQTTPEQAALAVLAAERGALAAAAQALQADAPAAAPASPAPADTGKTREAQAAEAQALAKDKGITVVAALKELGYA